MYKLSIVCVLFFVGKLGASSFNVESSDLFFSSIQDDDASNRMARESVHPDVGLNVSQLILKYGYPFESHSVETEDGYILEIHRMPFGRKSGPEEKKKIALLVPGLLCSSSIWIDMGPERSLGYLLADLGYDVWMGNPRGTTHSRRHVTLNPDKGGKFWDYSWHEIGYYDLPATIDYVLNYTNEKQLYYVGHSQGTTTFFVMASDRPEYNNKIVTMVALAPYAFGSHTKNKFVKMLAPNYKRLQTTLKLLGIYEILPHTQLISSVGQKMCNDESPEQDLCAKVFFMIAGEDPDQMNATYIPVITSNTPAGASANQLAHFAQLTNTGGFKKYDYGKRKNQQIYGQENPPDYNLSNVRTPVSLLYGENDLLSTPMDVFILNNSLPNVYELYKIKHENWNHLDFLWAIDVVDLVYGEVIRILGQF